MKDRNQKQPGDFLRLIQEKESRKIKAQDKGHKNIWMGFGMFGVVGWSIALPMILGIVLGMWLDKNYPGKMPWTVSLLFGGLTLGCFFAYYWISKEHRQIHDDHTQKRKKDE